jgi:large subunit ribosomal protein L10
VVKTVSQGKQNTAASESPITGKGRPVPKAKLDEVSKLVSLLEKHDYIGLVRTEQIGSKQFQAIKKALRPIAIIHMSRNSLMIRALEIAAKSKEKLDKLIPFIEGSCAFTFSDMSPFELNDLLQQNKAKAPAKAGSISPIDIVIPAGNTGFPPGPLITELGAVGLKTRIQGGSIWITQDHNVVNAGDTVNRQQALVLSRLGIEPLELWLKLVVAYDHGIILKADVFEITKSFILDQLHTAGLESLSLAVSIEYISPDSIQVLIQKAFGEARALAIAAPYLSDETTSLILSQTEQSAVALAQAVKSKNPDAMPN